MPFIKIHQEKVADSKALVDLCPFGAIESDGGKLSINSGCRMCRMCVRKGGGVFEFIDDSAPGVDKSQWRGISVFAEIDDGRLHPVTLELLGKARELADKVNHPVYAILAGSGVSQFAERLVDCGADKVYVYDFPELEYFRIEPYTAVLEDFIGKVKPSVVLVGGTVNGRSLAPRAAARFRTGLTADCTLLDISESTDLDQIRPAYGGNIMAHINTPRHRPQFATVRYKVFPIPAERKRTGEIVKCEMSAASLASAIAIVASEKKAAEEGIEEAEVLVVAGRGLKNRSDLKMLHELADVLGGKVASTRAVVDAGWVEPRFQIGISGRTVKPKLIITCGVSGAVQFVTGMQNAGLIMAINSDPEAPIFKVAHAKIVGDLYEIIPAMIREIKSRVAGGTI